MLTVNVVMGLLLCGDERSKLDRAGERFVWSVTCHQQRRWLVVKAYINVDRDAPASSNGWDMSAALALILTQQAWLYDCIFSAVMVAPG